MVWLVDRKNLPAIWANTLARPLPAEQSAQYELQAAQDLAR